MYNNTTQELEKTTFDLEKVQEDKSNLEAKLGEKDLTIKTLVEQQQSSVSAHEEVVTALGTLKDGVYQTLGSSQKVVNISDAKNVVIGNHSKIEECENLVGQLTAMQNRLEELLCETRNAYGKKLTKLAQELSAVKSTEKDLKVCICILFDFSVMIF